MENTTKKKKTVRKTISPYSVNQAFVGLGLEETDLSTIKYLNFLNTQVPLHAAFFFHVLPKNNLLQALYEKETQALISDYTIEKDMRKRMQDEVKSTLTTGDNIHMEFDISKGDPLEEMIAFTNKTQADLLVIGQDKSKSEHGIFAKNLARMTTADALIIPSSAKPGISTILVPIDFSENSVKALETAIAIHKCLKEPAQILCLHVYSMPNTHYFRNEKPWLTLKKTVESNLKDGFAAFLETAAGDYKKQIEITLVERQTTGTATFITDFATNNKVDFLVMGARGHSKVHLILMGSVTEGVLDLNKDIPTLVVRT